ncbi:MAG TPA: hypothetical protein VM581_01550, partial [Magnetospirillaceae bacterium]|nr:hypothetical protein [Magnetospirillaceae bacterium]
IPASDGTINGCRNNTTTMLRVIDSVASTCDANESALNWDQKGVKAYAFMTYNSSNNSQTLDTNRSYNISNFQYSDPFLMPRQICLTVNTIPRSISALPTSGSSNTSVGAGFKDSNGWTSANTCDTQSPGSNVFVSLTFGASAFVTIY